jgi:hypothetical protein
MSTAVDDLFAGKNAPNSNSKWDLAIWSEFNGWIQRRNRVEFLALLYAAWDDQPELRDKFKQRLLKGGVEFF